MKCNVCAKAIVDRYYINGLFGESACVTCIDVHKQICNWCGRYRKVKDLFGYQSCQPCRDTAVITERDIENLVELTLPIIDRHVGPNSYRHIPVRFGELIPSSYSKKPIGNAFFGGPDPHIRIQQGMPLGQSIGTLAHEYGHMMLNLDYVTLANRPYMSAREIVIEEGFCEVMCAVALLNHSSDEARWASFLMPANPDPVYGDGFRMMWPRALELGSIGALLQELTREPHPFRGPRPDELHDDFVIPDDIAPLVEVGSGDREKGVLRGTALLIRDLPDDAPVGPRLRGSGLAVIDKKTESTSTRVLKGTLRGTGLRTHDSPSSSAPPKKGKLRGKGLDKK